MPAPKATGILESRRLDILEALGTSDRSRNLNYKWLHLFHICIEIEVNDPASTACILDTRRLDIFEIKKYLEQLMDAITSMVANICLFQLFRERWREWGIGREIDRTGVIFPAMAEFPI